MEEEPKPVELNYHKPDPVFPTNTKDQILFWGCLTVMMVVFGAAIIVGLLVLRSYFLYGP